MNKPSVLYKSVEEDQLLTRLDGNIDILLFKRLFKSLFMPIKLDIDDENTDYWLFYSKINERLNIRRSRAWL